MKKLLAVLLVCAVLAGCGTNGTPAVTGTHPSETENGAAAAPVGDEVIYQSRFDGETVIRLAEGAMDVTGVNSWSVSMSKDIIYYEDREYYDSGNPYGEGEAWERHSMNEAQGHLVINITAPGAYRVSGYFPAGQIRVDLGEEAKEDPNAVVELILDGLDITCTVAPAIVFQNVYECDGDRNKDNAQPVVDTTNAGANLILEGENFVSGSHVAKIFKDKEDEKKLWKQDGAIYSYMSMNVFGPGSLDLTADNEGLDTELHLTIHGGEIAIRSDNDGINTNEDGVSVTTINGGNLHIIAGLGVEGDGIDSNGYLVINGGTVVAAANPASDAGLDSDLGSFIHGGTVIALGAAMDWAESDSNQVTMNLQFASYQQGGITVTKEDGTQVFSYDPVADTVMGELARRYQGAILSCGDFKLGDGYHVYVDGVQMAYTGTDVMMRPGMGGFGGGQPPQGGMPEGEMPNSPAGQEPPGGFGGFGGGQPPQGGMPEGEMPTRPAGEMPTWPEGEMPTGPAGQEPPGGFGGMSGKGNTVFYMQDKVNFFSGLTAAQ